MITSSPPKKDARSTARVSAENNFGDLRLISDLGRSLLFTVHPKKVAARVSEALQQGVDARLCLFVAEIESIGLISCACDAGGVIDISVLQRQAFEKWLSFMPPQIGYKQDDPQDFFIQDAAHTLEYVSPLHIDGEVKGAIVVAFNNEGDLDDRAERMIDAVTQMAAMSMNLSAHYEVALNDSLSRARDEDRRFTEAVLDALPVSLYVVDRDYRIVTWNRHRVVGYQGIPR